MLAWAALLLAPLVTAVSARAASDEPQIVVERPDRGFNYSYILRIPPKSSADLRVLLVETNNTGAPSDDPNVHLSAALELSKNGLGGKVADELGVPILMPVFPRPRADSRVYTHMLDRETLEISEGPMRRLDLQLIAMISDARQTLAQEGAQLDERVLLTGFSASGKFANRFTALHPRQVRAVATGGMNGIAILPLEKLADRAVPYPLGVAELPALTGSSFDGDAWRSVRQFLFMGADDTNDAVAFDDGYSEEERSLVYGTIGREMLPTRWNYCRDVYTSAGANATFRIYPGIGHGTNGAIRRDVAEFFRSVLSK